VNKISATIVEVEREIAELRDGRGRSRVGTTELLRRVLDALWEARPAEEGEPPAGPRPPCLPAAPHRPGRGAAVIAVLWEWADGPHKGARFWGCHGLENDGRLRDWPAQGLRPLGAARVTVVEGVGFELIRPTEQRQEKG
jgi:hypothetical protein